MTEKKISKLHVPLSQKITRSNLLRVQIFYAFKFITRSNILRVHKCSVFRNLQTFFRRGSDYLYRSAVIKNNHLQMHSTLLSLIQKQQICDHHNRLIESDHYPFCVTQDGPILKYKTPKLCDGRQHEPKLLEEESVLIYCVMESTNAHCSFPPQQVAIRSIRKNNGSIKFVSEDPHFPFCISLFWMVSFIFKRFDLILKGRSCSHQQWLDQIANYVLGEEDKRENGYSCGRCWRYSVSGRQLDISNQGDYVGVSLNVTEPYKMSFNINFHALDVYLRTDQTAAEFSTPDFYWVVSHLCAFKDCLEDAYSGKTHCRLEPQSVNLARRECLTMWIKDHGFVCAGHVFVMHGVTHEFEPCILPECNSCYCHVYHDNH